MSSLPPKELPLRWKRIQEMMAQENLGGLLFYSNQLRPEYIHYVANYKLLGEKAVCCLPLEGLPALFISEAWDKEMAVVQSGLEVTVMEKDWPRQIAAAARRCKGRLGVVGRDNLGSMGVKVLESALGRETVSATSLLDRVAVVKSPYELALIREAEQMADAGFRRAIEVASEGLIDYALAAEIDYAMRDIGATDNFQMLAIGKELTGMLLPFGKKVERGDLLLFEITPSNGVLTYSAQLCRTAIFGETPGSFLQGKYAILIEAQEQSLAIIKPGTKVSEVARIQNEIIGKAGYKEYCRPPYMRARGHSFGLGRIEVDEDSPLEFVEGMSVVVHPNQYIPETGYLALGEHIIVTATGIERLTRTASRIYECGGAKK